MSDVPNSDDLVKLNRRNYAPRPARGFGRSPVGRASLFQRFAFSDEHDSTGRDAQGHFARVVFVNETGPLEGLGDYFLGHFDIDPACFSFPGVHTSPSAYKAYRFFRTGQQFIRKHHTLMMFFLMASIDRETLW